MGRLTILIALLATAANAADWSALDRHQQTISRPEFDRLLATVFCPSGAFTNYLAYTTNSVTVCSTPEKTNALFTLRFASASAPAPTFAPVRSIALDPGHIGGAWARMEERYFVRGNGRPVQEAALNLTMARLLKPRLETNGFTVAFTKENFEPVTKKRPEDFRLIAQDYAAQLHRLDGFPPLERQAAIADAASRYQERMFYRVAEIGARAQRINRDIRPDLTLCIHFNAVDWNDRYDLVEANHLVIFVGGNYLPEELADDEQKFGLMSKLLERSHKTELAAAEAVADALARATKLPPVEYGNGSGAFRVGTNRYVYARNLAANRWFNGPVVYLEPYYMNNRITYQRIQLGDYDGEREIEGKRYRSIFREYADAVAEGLLKFVPR